MKMITVLMLFVAGPLQAQSLLAQGEEFFMRNQPAEAARLFEAALRQDPRNEKIYLYLGIVYEQLRNNERAISILRQGLEVAVSLKDLLYFNLGTNYFTRGEYETSSAMFSEALRLNGVFAEAYLNRAQTAVRRELFQEAVADYRLYLTLEPGSPQRSQIERMIAILSGIIVEREAQRAQEERRLREEAERARVAEERRKQEEEERRIAEERQRREAEERRRALLETILSSLQASGANTQNLAAEREAVRDVQTVTDIED